MATTPKNPLVGLTASVQATPERIIVTFQVTNRHDCPIYQFDRAFLVGPGGTLLPRPDHLLVSHEPPDGVVLASKLLPLPAHAAFAAPPTALGTKIDPGASYKGQAGAPMPLRPQRDQPGAPPADPRKGVAFKHLRFELGYVVHAEELAPVLLPAADGPAYQLRAAAWRLQQVVTTPPLDGKGIFLIPGS
jgi:hypothetical protein